MFARACLAAIAVLLVARAADACEPDGCGDAVAITDVARATTADIPTDGVLLLRISTSAAIDPERLTDRVHVTVSRDATPLPGALALAPIDPELLVWRPDVPLQPLAEHAVSVTLDNPDNPPGCAPTAPIELSFTTTDGASAPLAAPDLVAVTDYYDDPLLTLTGVVCCNDAFPLEQFMCGESYGITWSRGMCAARETRGYLRVQLTAETAADPASAGQWVRILRENGDLAGGGVATTFVRELEAPTCFRIDQRSLITGQVAEGAEQCFGDDDVDRLGIRPADPKAEIGERCTSDLYLCEIDEGAWDPMKCQSWGLDEQPPGDEQPPATAEGCDCRNTPSPSATLLLLALLRRRRR